jgi:hypothetical protein
MALTMSKLATHKKKNSIQIVILQVRKKVCKFWNINVRSLKTSNKFKEFHYWNSYVSP